MKGKAAASGNQSYGYERTGLSVRFAATILLCLCAQGLIAPQAQAQSTNRHYVMVGQSAVGLRPPLDDGSAPLPEPIMPLHPLIAIPGSVTAPVVKKTSAQPVGSFIHQSSSSSSIFTPASQTTAAAPMSSGQRLPVGGQRLPLVVQHGATTKVWQKPSAPRRHQAPQKIILFSDLIFESSKDRLTPLGESKLAILAAKLKADPDHPMVIVGHTDNLGFEKFNKDLSLRCAARIKSWLVLHGVAKSYAVTTIGMGSTEPLSPEILNGKDNAAGRAHNRRIEITIDPNVDAAALKAAAQAEADEKAEAERVQKLAAEEAKKKEEPLVESEEAMTFKPATEDDLMEHADPSLSSNNSSPTHMSNNGEWGRGGTNFGNNIPTFRGTGEMPTGPSQSVLEEQERRRKETVDAQNEFGLWRDR